MFGWLFGSSTPEPAPGRLQRSDAVDKRYKMQWWDDTAADPNERAPVPERSQFSKAWYSEPLPGEHLKGGGRKAAKATKKKPGKKAVKKAAKKTTKKK